jgi:enterochelin esterase-like enzyme
MLNSRLRLLMLVLAVVAVGAFADAASGHGLRYDAQVSSRALAGRVHALVFLPPGYWESGQRYPVVYFLHGLPAAASTYRANGWVARVLQDVGPAIVVLPQGARDGDADPEYLDWGSGRNWQTYVAQELPAYIDAHFRTIASRTGRALIGLSAGGYGAAVAGLNHLDRFAVVESWSGYFHPTDPSGTSAIDGGPLSNVHALLGELARDEARRSTFVAFYVGDDDTRFRDENEVLDRELTEARVPHLFQVYSGGHEMALWQRHARTWLGFALTHLAPPVRTS